jgi:predicted nucleotidyltransferase
MDALRTVDPAALEVRLAAFFATEAERLGIAAAYLFGSMARGTAKSRSDVDVAVLYEGTPPPGLAGLGVPLAGDLERLLGREVDVVVLNRAPADLVHRVLRDGHLLLDRNRSRRIAFEVQSRNEYFDLLPHLRRYRRMEGEEG